MRGRRSMAVIVSLGVVAGALAMALPGSAGASAPRQPFPKVDQPGVTDTEIHVGGVASKTNPLGGAYADGFDGVEAYFDYINSKKGVFGRKLKLTSKRDDQLGSNRSEVQGLISEDNVFAVMPVEVLLFTGADLLANSGIPTFGWNINQEYGSEKGAGPPNLFGEKGSFLCFTCASTTLPWLAKKLKAKRVAVLAYTVSQSAECLQGVEASFQKYPTAKIAYSDSSLSFGVTDLSVQVSKMKDANVDLVTTCMDNNGTLTLAKEMKKQGLDAPQYLPNAYNQKFIDANGQFFEGSYVLTFFTPFEAKPQAEGIKLFLKYMKKRGVDPNENSLAGWINADLFVTALKAAGPDFTRQKVIDEINKMTSYTAKGILGGIDWTVQHADDPVLGCTVLSKIHKSKFVPSFGEKDKPFICFPRRPDTLPEPTRKGFA